MTQATMTNQQSLLVAAIVKDIKELTLVKSAELTSRLEGIQVVDINYRQLQAILKVYRQEHYTNTPVAGKGITTEVLRSELHKAISNQISGTKLPAPEKKAKSTKKAKNPASKPLSTKPANPNKYVYFVKATNKKDNLEYYWNCHEMVQGQKSAYKFNSHKEANNNLIFSGLALAPEWTNTRVIRAQKKVA